MADEAPDGFYRRIVERAAQCVWLLDPRGVLVYCNPYTDRFLGYDHGALVGRSFFDMLHEDDRVAAIDRYEERRRGVSGSYEVRVRRKDGTHVWVLVSATALLDPDGRFAGAIDVLADISRRKQVERELLESRKQLVDAQEIAHVGSWRWSIQENRVEWSQELYRIYGLDRSTFVPTLEGVLAHVHPEDRGTFRLTVERAFREKTPFEFEHRIVRPDGEVRHLTARGRVMTGLSGEPLWMEGTGQDITERKLAEEQLRLTATELERRNEELQAFAYVASHDLQEPLRMVTSYVQLLHLQYAGKLDANADEFIGYAVAGARRMHALITDLLALSRLDSQARPPRPCEAGPIAQGALGDLRLAIQESQAQVTVGPLPTVLVDPGQLRQVLVNLIGNAVKFCRPGQQPRVTVSAERQDGLWLFSVADEGIGIEPQFYGRIFRVFQRLHPRDEYPGTGIGLAICKKIVERHGGRIWVEANAAGGATFKFTLPAA